jgi:hypothetical protein
MDKKQRSKTQRDNKEYLKQRIENAIEACRDLQKTYIEDSRYYQGKIDAYNYTLGVLDEPRFKKHDIE